MADRKADDVLRAWAALGIAFDSVPLEGDIDLERLLLESARRLPRMPRLLPLVVTWLRSFGDAVARHRLRRLIAEELEPEHHGALGLLLTLADAGVRPARFTTAVRLLRPVSPAHPLFDVQRATPALIERARARALPASRRWGVWTEPFEPRPDAVLPPHAALGTHSRLRTAIDFRGDLRASVLASLAHDPAARDSESALATCAGGSRAQVRHAIENLEVTGRVRRIRRPGVRCTRVEPAD